MTSLRHEAEIPASRAPAYGGHPSLRSVAKRGFDLGFALVAIVVTLPLFAILGAAVRLTSPGPVFFRQRRVGLHGRAFVMLKFRSMHFGASEERHREYVASLIAGAPAPASHRGAFKLANDGRITAVGAFLRRTSLDELPQFWNVLTGDMSVVGPRPPLEYEVALYADWQWERLSVKPGITGHWQVSGRNRHAYVDMVRLDIEYVRHWSFWRDLGIVMRTPFVMLTNSGRAA